MSWGGISVDDSHVTTLHLALRSRRDIREDAFARGECFAVDIGVPILAVLAKHYLPSDGRCPQIGIAQVGTIGDEIEHLPDEGEIRIGPDLLHRNADLTLTVVLWGA